MKHRFYKGISHVIKISTVKLPCILVSDHSHLSWMEFLDYALGFYMDNLAGCRCIICCAFRHYEIRSWRKGINLVLPEVLY